MFLFEQVAIVGPGLIGGSMGVAIRRRKLARKVVGIGRRPTSLDVAMDVGACDEVTLDVAQGTCHADLVVIATPIGAFGHLALLAAEAMKAGAVITDVASTKCAVIEVITEALAGREDLTYIPTHPMAGSEQRGASAADEGLFEGSFCIFTPVPGTPEEPLGRLRRLWEALGAQVRLMTPAAHDRLVARISHVPHLVAAALVAAVDDESLLLSGGGLIDTTRIASSDVDLWCDICRSNSAEISTALQEHGALVERMRRLLAQGHLEELRELLRQAKTKRDALLARRAGHTRKKAPPQP